MIPWASVIASIDHVISLAATRAVLVALTSRALRAALGEGRSSGRGG
jgi:hypothetical protein